MDKKNTMMIQCRRLVVFTTTMLTNDRHFESIKYYVMMDASAHVVCGVSAKKVLIMRRRGAALFSHLLLVRCAILSTIPPHCMPQHSMHANDCGLKGVSVTLSHITFPRCDWICNILGTLRLRSTFAEKFPYETSGASACESC